MTAKPVNLTEALASFDDVYSPRIVARMNDYDVRIAHTLDEHVWHVHEDTDEFFLVLDGRFDIALRDAAGVETTVVLVGGMRTLETIEALLGDRECDFVALARPLIREPGLVRAFGAGLAGAAACTSCNLCLGHEGHHSLRCWRVPRRRLLQHALYRVTGGFKRGPVLGLRS